MLKRFNKEIVNILDENILLLDDDVQNLKLANDYGFQWEHSQPHT